MFSYRLKQLREDAGLTQAELAKKLNLTQSTIAYYENGRKMPTMENAKILAQIFDTSLDYLFGISNKKVIDYPEGDRSSIIVQKLSEELNSLSKKSLEDLESYVKLLKIRDMQKRNLREEDELSSFD
ncbi:MAG: helix-turn-helix transcriptional regulator [Tissierellaceae bacterium]